MYIKRIKAFKIVALWLSATLKKNQYTIANYIKCNSQGHLNKSKINNV